jgi:26S proteasome regulatory subunit N11
MKRPSRCVTVWRDKDSGVYGTDVQEMLALATAYTKSVQEETTMTAEQLKTRHVGKLDPKRHLGEAAEKAMGDQVSQSLAMGVLAEL